MRKKSLLMSLAVLTLLFTFTLSAAAQDTGGTAEEKFPYEFSMIKELDHTPVKSQGRTGTCWSFATVSMLESEAMRK